MSDPTQATRFGLLEIDGVKAPTIAPAPIVVQVGEGTARAGELDTDGRARCIAVDAVARKHGLAFDEPTIYAWGTQGQWGDSAKRARMELSALPLMSTLATIAGETVRAESRRGDVVSLAACRYGTDDRIRTRDGSQGASCSPQALRQLMGRCDAPGASYLSDARIPGALRAPHVNHWVGLATGEESDRSVKLLSKLDGNGARALYGVVGQKFPHTYDMARVIADVAASLPSTARGALHYDASSTRWRVDAAIGAEFEPVVGDVHRMGLKFGAHDAGGGSYFADVYAVRARCVNFTKIVASTKLGRVRHVGDAASLRARVMELISVGADAMHDFSTVWREANEQAICDRTPGDARDVFRALIRAGYIGAPDGEDTAVENYHNAWLVEPGQTRADYCNAVTRAAHESAWSSPWATDTLEEQAGQLLFNRVVLTDAQMTA